jgi:serine/threonine-protein kinase
LASDLGDLDSADAVPGYRLVAEIGCGGMGVVYAASQEGTGRQVAIKVIRPGDNQRARRRFLREARAAQAVRHPGVVRVHGYGEHGDLLYLVMDRVEGEDLQRVLDRDGPLPPDQAVAVVGQVAAAAGALHEAGVVHCDIKPANVLVSTGGTAEGGPRALLTDFGVAGPPLSDSTVSRLSEDPQWLRSAGTVTAEEVSGPTGGTYLYMSPEQWRGEPVDARTDVYGLGALLYAALTGQPPHAAATLPELVYAVVMAGPPSARQRNAEVSEPVDAVVARAMAREPADRFGTAEELRAALVAALAGHRPGLARSAAGRRRTRLAWLAVTLVVLAGVVVGTARWWHPGGPQIDSREVCARDITLRSEPAQHDVIATLHRGDRVSVTGSARGGRWARVTAADGRAGWALTEYLSATSCGS